VKKREISAFPAINSLLLSQSDGLKFAEYLNNEGSNREKLKFNQLGAENDIQAVQQFLDSVRHSQHTVRTYTKEIERFLLWCLLERHRILSSITLKDFVTYEKFIMSPSEHWCGVRGTKQITSDGIFNQKWRPFTGPLSLNSQKIAIATINSMMNFLVSANYLSANPLNLDKKHRQKLARKTKQEIFHALSNEEWQFVWDYLYNLPQDTESQIKQYERLRFILIMFYCTACRIGEFASHTMGSFNQHSNGKWYWHVIGKGDKPAELPVNHILLDSLVRYRKYLGLSPLPVINDEIPLLLNKNGNKGVTARQLSRLLNSFFSQVAEKIEDKHPHSAENIRQATAHWIRHTALSHAAQRTKDLRLVQRFGRHDHIQTSMLYIHVDDEELENLMSHQDPE
jgi:site-specific recombinase XerD